MLEDPVELHACHCTDCQTATGAAYVLTMIVRRAAFETLQGKPALIEYTNQSGIECHDRCCPRCQVRVWSEGSTIPDLMALRPGTLDDTSWVEPTSHIWTRSAQPGVAIPDHTYNFSQQPTPEETLEAVRLWKGRAR
jgi:hypothetical protein